MPLPFFQVDSFASQPFHGNPAAVVLLDGERPDHWMQAVAMENNLSETAFVRDLSNERYSLRWCTPTIEVDLCGHATLAAAHVLWETNAVPVDKPIVFETRSGQLTVTKGADGIQLNFPALKVKDVPAPEQFEKSFRVDGRAVSFQTCGRSQFDYVLQVADEASVRGLEVDFATLAQVQARGIIVTALADKQAEQAAEYDFVSRFFGPAAGVDEDPVTGSAHCALIEYWSRKLGRTKLIGYQASARGGLVRCDLQSDRALLTGEAITVIRGELLDV